MHVIYFPKPEEWTTQFTLNNINYGLKLIMLYQYWLTDCNKDTSLIQDVNNRVCMQPGKGFGGDIWEAFSINLKLLFKDYNVF